MKDEQYGWAIYPATQLSQNGLQADLVGMMRHEIGHALGIAASIQWPEPGSDEEYRFSETINSYTSHLYDQNGNQAVAGARIVNDSDQAEPGDFVVEFDNENGGGNIYFAGEYVKQVLNGARLGQYQVAGVPVNGWEWSDGHFPEISHLQIDGLMSHQSYVNYTTFTEVELAVMQDIGYVLDRRNFYGYSIYDSGLDVVNENGYSARNDSGTGYLAGVYNEMALGVGLHIYGGNNKITQAADILTMGTAAIGIRVDGQENELTIGDGIRVYANGTNGTGVLVAAGKNQRITHRGDIRALGKGGIGARFDFGDSSNGQMDNYRGSYLHYQYDSNDPDWSYNLELLDQLNGAQVESFDVAGTLAGEEAAIYIGVNAFVKEINVLDGAYLSGDIISKWNNPAMYDLLPGLKIQYEGEDELVTNLNFSAGSLVYDGNITGEKNLRLHVTNGALNYTGMAAVLSADIGAGASLTGNAEYRLDSGNGWFTNHGLMSPAIVGGKIGEMKIDGNFESDGSIGIAANREECSAITVRGNAEIDGTKVVRMDGSLYLPDTSYAFLKANAISGDFVHGAFSGMLGVKTEVKDKVAEATLMRENNLGAVDRVQEGTYRAMDAMYRQTDRKAEMAGLYSLDAAAAKQALTDIAGGVQSDMGQYTRMNRMVGRAVAGRMAQVNQTAQATADSAVAGLAGRDFTADDVIALELDNEYGWWIHFGKSWAELDHGNNKSHSSSIVLGADKRTGENWLQGILFAYGDSSFATVNANGKNHDYRVGLYGVYSDKAKRFYTYFDAGRQANEATRNLRALGLSAGSDYDSDTLALGAEYKYDLQYGKEKTWHVSPYVNARAVRYTQDGYGEMGAGIYNQQARSSHDTYTAGEIGMELARNFGKDGYALRLGYRRTFSGADPDFKISYEGNPGDAFTAGGAIWIKTI